MEPAKGSAWVAIMESYCFSFLPAFAFARPLEAEVGLVAGASSAQIELFVAELAIEPVVELTAELELTISASELVASAAISFATAKFATSALGCSFTFSASFEQTKARADVVAQVSDHSIEQVGAMSGLVAARVSSPLSAGLQERLSEA